MAKGKKGGHGGGKSPSSKDKPETPDEKVKRHDPDDEFNSGFGSYLRSGEGLEMMRLFVIANSVVVFITVAWPNIQQSLYFLRDLILGEPEYEDVEL